MLLALTYLFVGLAHTVSCADEAIGFAISSDTGNASGGGSHDGDPKKSPLVAESCHISMPILTPPFFAVAVPLTDPRKLAFAEPTELLAGHPWLDTPPPKQTSWTERLRRVGLLRIQVGKWFQPSRLCA